MLFFLIKRKAKDCAVLLGVSVNVNTTAISAQDKNFSSLAKKSKVRVVTRFDQLRETREHCLNTIFSCDRTQFKLTIGSKSVHWYLFSFDTIQHHSQWPLLQT